MKANVCWGLASIGLSLVIGTGLVGSAKAQTVLVDFGTNLSFRGANSPNPDPNGHYWNNYFPGVFFTDFKDINNVATTIDFGPDGTGVGTDSYNGPAGDTSAPPTSSHIVDTDINAAALGNLGVKEAAFDYAASPGPDAPGNTLANLTRFQIQSLDIAKTYTLTLFGSHKYSADATTVYSVFNNATYTSLIGTALLNVHDIVDASKHNRDTVATISGLVPDASGILYLQFVGLTGAQGYLNSMQITAVPEPSTLVLLAVSGLAICFRRRGR